MKCSIAVLGVIFLIAGLTGCATSPQVIKVPPTVVVGRPASLDFILVTTTNTLPDVQAETALLQDSILSGLRQTSLFPNIDTVAPKETPAAGIQITASITQITKVSNSARAWYGGLAGKAQVVALVKISDLASHQPIEEFGVEGHTGASARSGLTDEAVQLAAAQVVDEIKHLDAQAAQFELEHGTR